MKVPLKEAHKKARDPSWVAKIRRNFITKPDSPATRATKNTKRKKLMEVLSSLSSAPFPLELETLASLAAVLDSTGMKAGDQYLSEAKALHVEAGFDWSLQLDKQLSACKRAMQRDKGPEVRAKEVKLSEMEELEWQRINKAGNEPRRVAWSYAWAVTWMLRAIEASQLTAVDVVLQKNEGW